MTLNGSGLIAGIRVSMDCLMLVNCESAAAQISSARSLSDTRPPAAFHSGIRAATPPPNR
jgi:hypothetical protein